MTPLAYRDQPLLTDRAALPHPFAADAPVEPFLKWGLLLGGLVALALFAAWRHRVAARDAGTGPPPAAQQVTDQATPWRGGAGLFLVSLALRLLGVDLQPADSQELTYLLQVAYPRAVFEGPLDAFAAVALSPQMVSPHPPLFRVLLLFWMEGGESLAWLRLPAVLAGAATVPLVFVWARRLLGGRAAMLAAVLLAISPLHIYYSQTVMPYTVLALAAVAACSLHDRALQPGGPWGRYTVALAVGFVSHFIFPALVAPLALEACWRRWRSAGSAADRARFWRFVGAGAVSLLPLAGYSLALFFYGEMMAFILPVIEAMQLFDEPGLTPFLQGFFGFFIHGVASTLADPGLPLLALPAGLVTLHALATSRGPRAWTVALPVALVSGFFLALGLVTIAGNGFFYFASRRFVPLLPFIYLLFAGGLVALHRIVAQRAGQRVAGGLVAGVVLLTAVPQIARSADQSTRVVKPDLPAAVAHLHPRLETGDAVAVGPYLFFDFMYSFAAADHVDDWYQAGGAPRWVRYRGPDGALSDVMLSASDMLLPWGQVLEHAGLQRVWLLDVDEVPFDLRELKGRGTVTLAPLAAGGFVPCDEPDGEVQRFERLRLRCLQRRDPAPPARPVLEIGREDYRQVMGLSPPGAVESRFRRIGPDSAVVLPAGTGLSLTLDTRLPKTPADVTVVVESADGASRTTPVQLRLDRGTSEHELALIWTGPPPGEGELVRVRLTPADTTVHSAPACFSPRRGRIQRLAMECGVFLKRVAQR